MNRKLSTLFITLLTLLVFSCCITGCGNSSSKFTGSKTANDNQFLADFDMLNSTIESTIKLKAGESIDTAIDIKKGKVDILVKNENGTVAYKGDDVDSSSFSIGITEDGSYTFSITGSKANGSVHFIKAKK
jgi:hypothetical protein